MAAIIGRTKRTQRTKRQEGEGGGGGESRGPGRVLLHRGHTHTHTHTIERANVWKQIDAAMNAKSLRLRTVSPAIAGQHNEKNNKNRIISKQHSSGAAIMLMIMIIMALNLAIMMIMIARTQ